MTEKHKTVRQPAKKGDFCGKIVFLVDDDKLLLDFERMLLVSENIPFLTFENAESAWAAFKEMKVKPALIISDYQMGRMNGLQLLENAKQLSPRVKTMLVSGTVESDVIETAAVKIDVFIPKPFRAAHFLETTKTLLNHEPKRKKAAGKAKPLKK